MDSSLKAAYTLAVLTISVPALAVLIGAAWMTHSFEKGLLAGTLAFAALMAARYLQPRQETQDESPTNTGLA